MIELLDVVMARYNRSHRTARAYHLALMELAGRFAARAAGRVTLKRKGKKAKESDLCLSLLSFAFH